MRTMRGISSAVLLLLSSRALAFKECLQPLRTTWDEECPVPYVAETICHTSTCPPTKRNVKAVSTPAGSLVAHALHAEFDVFDMVLIHDGAVHGALNKGDFRLEDVMQLLPYNEEMIGLQLNSSSLVAALEHGIDQYHFQNVTEAYPRAAGIRFHVDLQQPLGRRISKVQVLSHSCRMEPLDDQKLYHVLTNQGLADGGYGYASLTRSSQYVHTKLGLTDSFWFHAHSVCTIRDPFRKPKQPKQSKKKDKKLLPKTTTLLPKQQAISSASKNRLNQTTAASR